MSQPESVGYPIRPVMLVCGSAPRRDRPGFRNWHLVAEVVGDFDPQCIVVEGGAAGPDTWARKAAKARGIHVATVPALWDHFGRAAGGKRNLAMLYLGITHVIAFWDGTSPGTKLMCDLARGHGLLVTRYAEDGSSTVDW